MSEHARVPHVITVALHKGGVAKTTTTINLGYELHRAGQRVLLIDLDQQANTTRGLGLDPDACEATMWEVLHLDREERLSLPSVAVPTDAGPWVAPGALALRKLERTGLGAGGQARLARQVRELEAFDVVLIDCPPSLGELTVAALGAADDVLATVGSGTDELDALIELEQTVADVRDALNPSVAIRYVLATEFDGRTQLGKDVRRTLRADWPGEYLGEIHSTVRVREAKGRQVPVGVHAGGCTATDDYRHAAATVLDRMYDQSEGSSE